MLSGLTLIRSSDVSEIVRFSARTAWQLSLGAPSVEVCSQSSPDHSFTNHHFPQDANSLLRQASLSRFPVHTFCITFFYTRSLRYRLSPRLLDLGRNTLSYTWFATAQFFSQLFPARFGHARSWCAVPEIPRQDCDPLTFLYRYSSP
jgi:hypothetical protein